MKAALKLKAEPKEIIKNCLISTGRSGVLELIDHMEQSGFFDAPCSSKYHLATPGGLAAHSINVCETALDITEALFFGQEVPIEFTDSIILCALLHDLGKAGQFGKPNYKMQIDGETGETSFTTNKDLLFVPHEVRSVAIASRFIELTEEEQFAILYNNGLYTDLGNAIKGKETPLYMILHFADMWASRVIESEK